MRGYIVGDVHCAQQKIRNGIVPILVRCLCVYVDRRAAGQLLIPDVIALGNHAFAPAGRLNGIQRVQFFRIEFRPKQLVFTDHAGLGYARGGYSKGRSRRGRSCDFDRRCNAAACLSAPIGMLSNNPCPFRFIAIYIKVQSAKIVGNAVCCCRITVQVDLAICCWMVGYIDRCAPSPVPAVCT